jgi:hypothetical protein
MFKAATTLINVLNAVDIVVNDESDKVLQQFVRLKQFVNLPLYNLYVELKAESKTWESDELAQAIYAKAAALYNLKEYHSSLQIIVANITNFNPINNELIKLLIANLYSLRFLELSGKLYLKLYEEIADLECLYFSGLSYYFLQQQTTSLPLMEQFVQVANGSVRYQKELSNLIKTATKLTAQMQQDTTTKK